MSKKYHNEKPMQSVTVASPNGDVGSGLVAASPNPASTPSAGAGVSHVPSAARGGNSGKELFAADTRDDDGIDVIDAKLGDNSELGNYMITAVRTAASVIPEARDDRTISTIYSFIKDVKYMQKLQRAQVRALAGVMELRSCKAKSVLCHIGDEGFEYYVILSGGIQVQRPKPGESCPLGKHDPYDIMCRCPGRAQELLGLFGPSEGLGEAALQHGIEGADCMRRATVLCAVDSELLVLTAKDFQLHAGALYAKYMESCIRFLSCCPVISSIFQTAEAAPQTGFGQITKKDLSSFANLLQERKYAGSRAKSILIFKQGDLADKIVFVKKGSAHFVRKLWVDERGNLMSRYNDTDNFVEKSPKNQHEEDVDFDASGVSLRYSKSGTYTRHAMSAHHPGAEEERTHSPRKKRQAVLAAGKPTFRDAVQKRLPFTERTRQEEAAREAEKLAKKEEKMKARRARAKKRYAQGRRFRQARSRSTETSSTPDSRRGAKTQRKRKLKTLNMNPSKQSRMLSPGSDTSPSDASSKSVRDARCRGARESDDKSFWRGDSVERSLRRGDTSDRSFSARQFNRGDTMNASTANFASSAHRARSTRMQSSDGGGSNVSRPLRTKESQSPIVPSGGTSRPSSKQKARILKRPAPSKIEVPPAPTAPTKVAPIDEMKEFEEAENAETTGGEAVGADGKPAVGARTQTVELGASERVDLRAGAESSGTASLGSTDAKGTPKPRESALKGRTKKSGNDETKMRKKVSIEIETPESSETESKGVSVLGTDVALGANGTATVAPSDVLRSETGDLHKSSEHSINLASVEDHSDTENVDPEQPEAERAATDVFDFVANDGPEWDRSGPEPVLIRVGTMGPYEFYGLKEVMGKKSWPVSLVGTQETEIYFVPKHEMYRGISRALLDKMRTLTFTTVPSDQEILAMLHREKRWESYKRSLVEGINSNRKIETDLSRQLRPTPSNTTGVYIEPVSRSIGHLSEKECRLFFGENRHLVQSRLSRMTDRAAESKAIQLGDQDREAKAQTSSTSYLSLADLHHRANIEMRKVRKFDERVQSSVHFDVAHGADFDQQWHATSVLRLKRDLKIYQSQELDDVGDFDVVFRGHKISRLNKDGLPWAEGEVPDGETWEEADRFEVKEFFLAEKMAQKEAEEAAAEAAALAAEAAAQAKREAAVQAKLEMEARRAQRLSHEAKLAEEAAAEEKKRKEEMAAEEARKEAQALVDNS